MMNKMKYTILIISANFDQCSGAPGANRNCSKGANRNYSTTFYLISSTKIFMNCPTGMSTDKFAFTKIRIASKNSV